MKLRHPFSSRAAARGLSLIELMVSVAIGLVVVLTVLAAYLGSGISGRHSNALGQMTEDASVALNILRSQIAMAGYSQPYGSNATTGLFNRTYTGPAVFGCDAPFTDAGSATLDALTCSSSGTGDAIAVAYQADTSNAVASSGAPTDCIGNPFSLTAAVSPVPQYYRASNRYYIGQTGSGATAVPELYCRGMGTASPTPTAQPLVSNISDMQLTYGVGSTALPNQVVIYKTATDLGAVAQWANVVSVRICIVVRSANLVMDAVTDYTGCSGSAVTPGDRRMYRAFTTTVVLHNRLGGT